MSGALCIYHGGCDDGFGAAYAVWKARGDAVEFYPGVYQQAPPDVAGRDVIIVDFSYKRPVMMALAESCRTLIVLDHHKTAEEDLRDFPLGTVIFDMERSGAMMAWNFFHPVTPAPDLIRYIQDRDLWKRELPGVDEFSAALRSYPQDFGVWDALRVPALIEEGHAILRYYRAKIEETKKQAVRRVIAGHDVPVCNAPYFMASELAGDLAAGEPFAAVWYEGPNGINFSLRSREGGIDVSEIARRFGGGGHRGAAGFRVKIDAFATKRIEPPA